MDLKTGVSSNLTMIFRQLKQFSIRNRCFTNLIRWVLQLNTRSNFSLEFSFKVHFITNPSSQCRLAHRSAFQLSVGRIPTYSLVVTLVSDQAPSARLYIAEKTWHGYRFCGFHKEFPVLLRYGRRGRGNGKNHASPQQKDRLVHVFFFKELVLRYLPTYVPLILTHGMYFMVSDR